MVESIPVPFSLAASFPQLKFAQALLDLEGALSSCRVCEHTTACQLESNRTKNLIRVSDWSVRLISGKTHVGKSKDGRDRAVKSCWIHQSTTGINVTPPTISVNNRSVGFHRCFRS